MRFLRFACLSAGSIDQCHSNHPSTVPRSFSTVDTCGPEFCKYLSIVVAVIVFSRADDPCRWSTVVPLLDVASSSRIEPDLPQLSISNEP
ncbi:unnamed protein product [Angiostrongylus costaricensis]|uniref:Secreted protein n=1 Tax=Angiostrongylus costaricensis TaxID=334426 RepID=A0A0R3PQZ0_ANGCS|nr:unnamed protein product [Angiostrongylus costaricensis]